MFPHILSSPRCPPWIPFLHLLRFISFCYLLSPLSRRSAALSACTLLSSLLRFLPLLFHSAALFGFSIARPSCLHCCVPAFAVSLFLPFHCPPSCPPPSYLCCIRRFTLPQLLFLHSTALPLSAFMPCVLLTNDLFFPYDDDVVV